MKTRWINKFIISVIAVAIISLVYFFLWGKLFVYSPIKIGFSKQVFSNVILYIQNGVMLDTESLDFDSYILSVEVWHNLRFKKKPKIFIFGDKKSYLRRNVTKARFYAYPNGSLVISPRSIEEAKEGIISLEIYLKHELSHILLFQHMGIISAYWKYPRWLLEGIAVSSSNQMGTSWYPDKNETFVYIRQGYFLPPNYFKTSKEDKIIFEIDNPIAFKYSEFACIVEYLIEIYGRDKFHRYMIQLFSDTNHDKVFRKIYGLDFDSFLDEFKNFIINNSSITQPLTQ